MPAIITPNSKAGEKSPEVPFKDDGTFYTYIMYFDNNSRIAYSDHIEELIELIIPKYVDYDEEQKLDARLKFALDIQSYLQHVVVNSLHPEEVADLKQWELDVLSGTYNDEDQFAVRGFWKEQLPEGVKAEDVPEEDRMDVWAHDTPIVLIDAAYEPWTDRVPPLGNPEDNNIVWLRPTDEIEFLESLAEVGLIAFGGKK